MTAYEKPPLGPIPSLPPEGTIVPESGDRPLTVIIPIPVGSRWTDGEHTWTVTGSHVEDDIETYVDLERTVTTSAKAQDVARFWRRGI